MTSFETSGEVIKIFPIQKGTSNSGKEWKSMNFVIEIYSENGNKEQVCFNIFGNKLDTCFNFKIGDFVTVVFNILSREYKDKFFTTLAAWKVINSNSSATTNSSKKYVPQYKEEQKVEESSNSSQITDDLPF